MPIPSEAVEMMPDERVEEVFGDRDMFTEPYIEAQWTANDQYTRSILGIADSLGARQMWSQNAGEIEGGLNRVAEVVRLTRNHIAEKANIDPKEFDQTVNSWWQAFASKGSSKSPGCEDFCDIDREVSMKIAFQNYPLEFAVGFGGTNDQEFTSRALGWVTSGLDFLQSFTDIGFKPPTLRVCFADELSGYVNALDPDITNNVSRKTATLITDYVREYYPELNEYLQVTTPKLESIIESLGKIGINGNAPEILETLRQGPEERVRKIDRITEAGENKGSTPHGTAIYVLGHVAPEIFGTFIDPESGSISVIKGGGPSERDFTEFQRIIAEVLSSASLARTHAHTRHLASDQLWIPKQIAIEGRNHKHPPYYRDDRAGDIVVDYDGQLLKPGKNQAKPDRDTKLAIARVGGVDSLEEFIVMTARKAE